MPARGQGQAYQGMNWIRQEKRLAIYLRDGLACVYCNATIEDTKLTLDHITPYSQGGSNHYTNLVTACQRCNSSRGDRSITDLQKSVAQYLNHNTTPQSITQHISACILLPLDIVEAKQVLARRKATNN